MKKLMINLFAVVIVLTTACSKESPEVYSHEPEINKWVLTNKQELLSYELIDMQALDLERQQAVYRMFEPHKRLAVWKNKVKELMKIDFTVEEISHIKKLYDAIELSWFDVDKTKSYPKVEHFMRNWSEYGMINFNWSKEMIYSMVMTLNKKNSRSDSATMVIASSDLTMSAIRKCYCTPGWPSCPSSGPSWDPEFSSCRNAGCSGTADDDGCGWLFQYECTGICYWPSGEPA